jgi:hypothetical protein
MTESDEKKTVAILSLIASGIGFGLALYGIYRAFKG